MGSTAASGIGCSSKCVKGHPVQDIHVDAEVEQETGDEESDCSAEAERRARFRILQGGPGSRREAAKAVVTRMLAHDGLSMGQSEDLKFVAEVLDELVDAPVAPVDPDTAALAHLNDSDIDDSVKEWLKSFCSRRGEETKSLRQVVKGLVFIDRLKGRRRSVDGIDISTLSVRYGAEASAEIAKLDSWGDFNLFKLAGILPNPLQAVATTALLARQLLSRFGISEAKLASFLSAIEGKYRDNAYHNALHGADVVQSFHSMLGDNRWGDFTELEMLISLLAAACHDVGHQGVTNGYRVATLDEDAITYNDASVNENMHCAIAFRTLLREEGCDCLDALSKEQLLTVRKSLIEIVLATDMAVHFSNLNVLKEEVEKNGANVAKWDRKLLALEAGVHSCDISNVTKPIPIALQWADRVLEEFFAQGDLERASNMPLSPLCDRHSVVKSKTQIGFVGFIVKPMFVSLDKLCGLSDVLDNIEAYHQHWSRISVEEQQAAEAAAKSGS